MDAFLATLALFALAMAAMAVGVVVSGKRLSGSCGGVPGKACACGPVERRACAAEHTGDHAAHKAAAARRDGKAHLDVLPDRDG